MLIYTPGIYPLISSVFPATIAIMIMMKMMIIIITYFIYFLPSYNCKCHYSYYQPVQYSLSVKTPALNYYDAPHMTGG